MTAAPLNRLTRLARALAVVTTRPPVAMTSTPLQLRNPLNGSGGTTKGARYAANARRVKERAVGRALARRMTPDYTNALPWVVVLTRVSPKPFDSDNLEAAFKSVRDGMAEAWGIDDADPRVTWVTDWRKGAKHAVEAALWVVPSTDVTQGQVDYINQMGGLCWGEERKPMPSDVEVDASDYERPRRSVLTPNVIRAKGGA